MTIQTFEEENFLAEAYDDGQFRFIESFRDEEGDPAKHTLWFNGRNFNAYAFNHNGSGTSSWLENLLAKSEDSLSGFAPALFQRGVELLKKHKIEVPKEPTGYPALASLFEDLKGREAVDLNDLEPGMLIAYLSHVVGRTVKVDLFKTGKIKDFMQSGKMAWVEPTEVSDTYLVFSVKPGTDLGNAYECTQIGDFPETVTLEREYPTGRTKIVRITEEDMRKVKSEVPIEVDKSPERVHYDIIDTDLDALIAADNSIEEKVSAVLEFMRYSRREFPGGEKYKQACEFLIDNREYLKGPVPIFVSGKNQRSGDSLWEKITKGSEEACGCGEERKIVPLTPLVSEEYIPADGEDLAITLGEKVYLRPIGGVKESTFVEMAVKEDRLEMLAKPFAPLLISPDMFGNGYKLNNLSSAVERNDKPMELRIDKAAICAITAVDAEAPQVSIRLAKGVEVCSYD